mgnify:FL=1
MERLTERYKDSIANTVLIRECGDKLCKNICDDIEYNCSKCELEKVLEKLATYEDLEEQGLLVRLPVAIGDDIYKIPSKANYDLNVLNGYKANNRVYHQKVYSIVFSQRGWFVQCDKDSIHAPNVICVDVEYEKTWFLTCEEAEKKLEEMKNER